MRVFEPAYACSECYYALHAPVRVYRCVWRCVVSIETNVLGRAIFWQINLVREGEKAAARKTCLAAQLVRMSGWVRVANIEICAQVRNTKYYLYL